MNCRFTFDSTINILQHMPRRSSEPPAATVILPVTIPLNTTGSSTVRFPLILLTIVFTISPEGCDGKKLSRLCDLRK
jgi:hypothetical protein